MQNAFVTTSLSSPSRASILTSLFSHEHTIVDNAAPMLAYCPEIIEPGTVVKEMVQNIDIAPTIMDACGIQKAPQMRGDSFLPMLKGESAPDELSNIIDGPRYEDIIAGLDRDLFDWLEQTGGMEIPLKPPFRHFLLSRLQTFPQFLALVTLKPLFSPFFLSRLQTFR